MHDPRSRPARGRAGRFHALGSPATPLLATALALLACQPPAPGEPSPLGEEDGAAIRAGAESMRQAALEGDWATYAAQFAEDGVALPPNGPAIEGRQAIEEWASGFSVGAFAMNQLNLEGRGDLAYRRGTFTITLTPPGMEQSVSDEGKFLEIWKRQQDGTWKLAVDIWNSSRPPTAPAEGESEASGQEGGAP